MAVTVGIKMIPQYMLPIGSFVVPVGGLCLGFYKVTAKKGTTLELRGKHISVQYDCSVNSTLVYKSTHQ